MERGTSHTSSHSHETGPSCAELHKFGARQLYGGLYNRMSPRHLLLLELGQHTCTVLASHYDASFICCSSFQEHGTWLLAIQETRTPTNSVHGLRAPFTFDTRGKMNTGKSVSIAMPLPQR